MEEYKVIGIDLAKRKEYLSWIHNRMQKPLGHFDAEYMTASFVPFAKSFLNFL